MNRVWNVSNPHQGNFKKVLCVCSAGLLRSPTLAWVLSNPPYNFNTRAVGLSHDYALIPIDEVHIQWADIIIAVEEDILTRIIDYYSEFLPPRGTKLYSLDLPDRFMYRDPELIEIINNQLLECEGLLETNKE